MVRAPGGGDSKRIVKNRAASRTRSAHMCTCTGGDAHHPVGDPARQSGWNVRASLGLRHALRSESWSKDIRNLRLEVASG
eukprot:COSAG06_NODE_13800_length_1218_cov_1.046470_1_plen_79_part_10